MKSVYNIDWLEIYGVRTDRFQLPKNHDGGLYAVRRPYGTRVYNDIYDVYASKDNLYCTICMNPLSAHSRGGIINDYACHVKLANYYCYVPGAVRDFKSFLENIGVCVKNIARLDLCCDFQYFENGLAAKTFIKKYACGDYCKLHANKGRLYFTDEEVKTYESVTFGSPKSNVTARLYNKSLELQEVKDKVYIRDCWMQSNLKVGMNVWRCEFAIKAEGRKSVDKEEGVVYNIGLDSLCIPGAVRDYFLYYAKHYFLFSVYSPSKSKYRTKRLELFPDAVLGTLSPIDAPRNMYSTRTDRQVIKYLLEKSKNKVLTPQERADTLSSAYAIMRKCHLIGWAYSKGYLEGITSVIADSAINPYMKDEEVEDFKDFHKKNNHE